MPVDAAAPAPRPAHPSGAASGSAAPGCVAVLAWFGLLAGAVAFGVALVRWAPSAPGTNSMSDQFELGAIELTAWGGLLLAGACGFLLVLLPQRRAGDPDASPFATSPRGKLVLATGIGIAGVAILVWGVTGAVTERDGPVIAQIEDTYWQLLSWAGLGTTILAAILGGRAVWAIRHR